MYQKAQQLGGRTSKAIRMFGIEGNQGNIETENQKALRIWEKYIHFFTIKNIAQNILQLKQKRKFL